MARYIALRDCSRCVSVGYLVLSQQAGRTSYAYYLLSPNLACGCPRLQTWEGSRCSFVGSRRVVAWSSLPMQRGRHHGIIIAIGLLQFATKPVRNPLDLPHPNLLIAPHCDPPPPCTTGRIPFWDHGQNPIGGLE